MLPNTGISFTDIYQEIFKADVATNAYLHIATLFNASNLVTKAPPHSISAFRGYSHNGQTTTGLPTLSIDIETVDTINPNYHDVLWIIYLTEPFTQTTSVSTHENTSYQDGQLDYILSIPPDVIEFRFWRTYFLDNYSYVAWVTFYNGEGYRISSTNGEGYYTVPQFGVGSTPVSNE
jgi:hypothetical protein